MQSEINERVITGRKVLQKIDDLYDANRMRAKEIEPALVKMAKDWAKETVVVISPLVDASTLDDFVYAEPSPFVRQGNIVWNNVRNLMEARIKVLKSIGRTNGSSIKIIGGNNYEQNGKDNTMDFRS